MSTVRLHFNDFLDIIDVIFHGAFSYVVVLGKSSVVADDWRLMTGDYESSGNAQIAQRWH